MSSFCSFLPAGGWQRLMCDALWQSTLIAALGWLTAQYVMRQSAARAWVLLITLIACAVVPWRASPRNRGLDDARRERTIRTKFGGGKSDDRNRSLDTEGPGTAVPGPSDG